MVSRVSLHPADLPPERLARECEFQRTRRSGPGGQHRNKVETAIVLTHLPTGVTAEANERRSQHQNRQVALFRLRVQLALKVRCKRDSEQIPSSRWQTRCRGRRIAVRVDHEDFPALLAEALDILDACDMQIRTAAEQLGVTASQLTKFLKLEPTAIAQINRRREQLGLRSLR